VLGHARRIDARDLLRDERGGYGNQYNDQNSGHEFASSENDTASDFSIFVKFAPV
jgi:hypothetical protein